MTSAKKYSKKKIGVVSAIYGKQREKSKKRGHIPPQYTNKELTEWLFSQELFHVLYNNWVVSGYKKHLKPSIDRKNNDIHYCFENIQLMTWGENDNKERIAKRKRVIQINIDGSFVAEYESISEASMQTKICLGNIGSCVCGHRHHSQAGGFIWRYK